MSNRDPQGIDRAAGALLQEQWAGVLPLDGALFELLPELLGRLLCESLPPGDRSVGRVLLDRSTDLRVIETLKDYGKKRVRGAASEPERATATAIYFAAIAAALVFHGRKISQYSYEHLQRAFARLQHRDWVPVDLATLLADAGQACRHQGRRAAEEP